MDHFLKYDLMIWMVDERLAVEMGILMLSEV